ncbi:MAG: hypothetical protein ABI835_08880 [Chloroflexota bacterium]
MGTEPDKQQNDAAENKHIIIHEAPMRPLPNYSLSTECPACGTPTFRHACKVRCPRCGFAWDCSEL